jgi:hypothetical protein
MSRRIFHSDLCDAQDGGPVNCYRNTIPWQLMQLNYELGGHLRECRALAKVRIDDFQGRVAQEGQDFL